MDSSTRSTVMGTDAAYMPIDNTQKNSRRSYIWIICGVIAAMIIIGASSTGYISSKPVVTAFNTEQLRGNQVTFAEGDMPTIAESNQGILKNPQVTDDKSKDPKISSVKINDGESQKPSGSSNPKSTTTTKKLSTNLVETSPRGTTLSSAEVAQAMKEYLVDEKQLNKEQAHESKSEKPEKEESSEKSSSRDEVKPETSADKKTEEKANEKQAQADSKTEAHEEKVAAIKAEQKAENEVAGKVTNESEQSNDESAASTVVTSEVVEDKNSKADKVPSSEKKDADRGPSAGPEVKDKPEQL